MPGKASCKGELGYYIQDVELDHTYTQDAALTVSWKNESMYDNANCYGMLYGAVALSRKIC